MGNGKRVTRKRGRKGVTVEKTDCANGELGEGMSVCKWGERAPNGEEREHISTESIIWHPAQ